VGKAQLLDFFHRLGAGNGKLYPNNLVS